MPSASVRRPRGLIVLSLLTLAISCLGLVTTPSAAAAKAPAVSPAAPMAGEDAVVTGGVPTKVKRPVTLQRKSGSGWAPQFKGRTNAKGRYSLTTRFAAGTTIRVVAKKVTVKGTQYAAWTSKSRVVGVSAQSVALTMAPTAQVGSPVTVSATSSPVRVGRAVVLQKLSGGTWTTVGTDTQDAAGKTSYAAVVPAAAGTFSYRAVAMAWKGAPSRSSASASLVVTDPPSPGGLELVSAALGGGSANGASGVPRVSGNGRYVVFASFASNLVTGDTEAHADVFLRDLQTGTTVRVSQTQAGVGGDKDSWNPDVSDDGRFVAYRSSASNLGWNGGNKNDVLLWDRTTGVTTPVTPPLSEGELTTLDGAADGPRISGDGSTVAFVSDDPSLSDDGDLLDDAYVWDRVSGVHTWISHGAETSPDVYAPSNSHVAEVGALSDDGNRVPFTTAATLVSGTNPGPGCCTTEPDVYIWEGFGDAEVVTLATINAGNERHTNSDQPALSGNGTVLAFASGEENFTDAVSDSTPDVFTWSVAGGYDQTSTPLFTTSRQTSEAPAISQGGSTVVFSSRDDFLVNEPGNSTRDIFRWVAPGGLELVTHDLNGEPTNGSSTAPDVSSDGSVVVFQSAASDIVAGDTNATTDIFVFVD